MMGMAMTIQWLHTEGPLAGKVRHHWRHRWILLGFVLHDRDYIGQMQSSRQFLLGLFHNIAPNLIVAAFALVGLMLPCWMIKKQK